MLSASRSSQQCRRKPQLGRQLYLYMREDATWCRRGGRSRRCVNQMRRALAIVKLALLQLHLTRPGSQVASS